MRICTVVGARPQFVKAAVVSAALAAAGVEEVIVHTGQHYDASMDGVFFDELGIPAPALNLDVGSASHARQTGRMMTGLEAYLAGEADVDAVLVYGDTNSTIAAALVASKMGIPLAHVEAGLRSFNRAMPEEINRVVTDRLSQILFCPTEAAVEHLESEGMTRGVIYSGDVMLDATLHFADLAAERITLSDVTEHEAGSYYLATVHRAENTDDPTRLQGIFDGFARVEAPVLLPLHPRTRGCLDGIRVPANVHLMEPVGYLTMLTLVRHARGVLTDSGGLQKEALWLESPCVTLRDETEWEETLQNGWNHLAGADPDAIVAAVEAEPTGPPPARFGRAEEGTASSVIAGVMASLQHDLAETPQ